MGDDGRSGVGMRWFVLTPCPSPAKLERGDQSRALGRSNAVQGTLAQMFCPLVNPLGEGTGRLPAGRGLGKPGFPAFSPQTVMRMAHNAGMKIIILGRA